MNYFNLDNHDCSYKNQGEGEEGIGGRSPKTKPQDIHTIIEEDGETGSYITSFKPF